MPDLKNLVETELVPQHWISSRITERQQWEERGQRREKLYFYRENNKELERLDFSDKLTQVANRLRFQAYLDQEWQGMAQEQVPLSLIIGDLDFFKAYNNTYGHQEGDQCLQQVAKAIASALKFPGDLVPCYGGEEFLVILPNTKVEGALRVAEAIVSKVKALNIAHINSQISSHLTLSVGVASIVPSPEYSAALLMGAAERALEQAKAQGRDRIILHENLLRQTQLVEAETEKKLTFPNSTTVVKGAFPKTDLLMSYVAYYVSRGKSIVSSTNGILSFKKSVYQYWGYHKDFQEFWAQLTARRDFQDLHIDGDLYSFGQFLGRGCTVGECGRCNLPIPQTVGYALKESNCTLCIDSWLSHRGFQDPESLNFEEELAITRLLAIGTPPIEYQNLQELFSLNGFEVTFVSKLEEVSHHTLPPAVDLVVILAEVSEAEGKVWAQELNRYPQLVGVPILALSSEAGHGLPWMERTLGIEDYLLTPYSGDRLAYYLRHVLQSQLNTDTVEPHWFPR
jgi:diguanylate cyclase (GGDEF)-like protein